MSKKDIEVSSEEFIAYDLALLKNRGKWKKYARVVANAMSAIPWVGTILSSAASIDSAREQKEIGVRLK